MQSDTMVERKSESISMDDEQFADADSPIRNHEDVLIERPFSISPNTRPVNGNLDPEDEDDEDEDEDDLILGDETAAGDEEEFDVELEDEFDEDDVDEDDLVIDSDDDIDEDDEEEDDL